ncbi:ribonuclease R [Gammaproteobacteria bacterium]|nr:ribonuclease R [Gammaproteobacteria bacterium]
MPKPKHVKDPHAQREADKYDNPIPSREFILEHLEKQGEPVTHQDLCTELLLFDADSQEALRRRLIAMTRDGQLIDNRRGAYGLVKKMDLVKGTIQGNKEGFGFVIPDDGSADLFLSPNQMRKVFDGDTVLARISGTDRRGRREGKVVEVLERKSTQFVGRFYREAGVGIVVPHNRRITQEILIPAKKHKNAKDGEFVVVKVTSFGHGHFKTTGEVVDILGDVATPGMEVEVALRAHNIPHEWPKPALANLKKIAKAPDVAEIRKRIDLRKLPFVTIDGEDAKDYDDAVYCQRRRGNGWLLYVAIADVSHYVEVDTPLDQEAQLRGNSVYFPGHVIPMLPEVLSNGLCSLKPKEDRLVMVCQMEIDREGEITNYEFCEGVIHSHARLTYTEVAAMLQTPKTEQEERLQIRIQEKNAELLPDLKNLYTLYKRLYKARQERGALDFDSTETRIIFSDERKIKEIIPVERNDAHRLIEECMLCANVASADFLLASSLPTLYRVHEGPNPEKLENLYDFLRGMGIGLARKRKPTPADYQNILKRLKNRPDKHLIQTIVIRSLMQAVYQPQNLGHFGLDFEAYTHFTSPIRRYPDLLIHRAIRYLIRSRTHNENVIKVPNNPVLSRKQIYPYKLADLERLGQELSATERRADAATYDVIDWLKCEYIQQHIGEEFAGTIASVTGFGIFVELEDIYIEGLVHVTALANDYYHFDAIGHSLTGERTGKTFQLGDSVRVIVARVDLDDKKIDLQLVSDPASTGKGKDKATNKSRGKSRAIPKRAQAKRGKAKQSKQPRKRK